MKDEAISTVEDMSQAQLRIETSGSQLVLPAFVVGKIKGLFRILSGAGYVRCGCGCHERSPEAPRN